MKGCIMMKKTFLALGAAATFLLPNVAGAEGFAINEWSAEGVAMGGARMFAEGDAANVAYNPASITKVEGEAVKFSATYLSPHGKHEITGGSVDNAPGGVERGQNVVHAGWAPGTYYVKQMSDKDWFGIGLFTRYGTVSERERGEVAVSSNSFFAKMDGLSLTPTYARKFDKKWSAAVGADINYVGLELQKNMAMPTSGGPVTTASTQTEGTTVALGWNAAVNYAFDTKNEIGLVYRSEITHSMEADFKMYPKNGGLVTADAYGVVTLPESYAIGYNHKFDDKTRVELNATRTNWSSYDALDITLSNSSLPNMNGTIPAAKNYENGWRYAIGLEHKLSDKYSLMAGFAYDEGIIPYDGGDFMMPTGNRRTYSIGAQYHDKKQTLAVALGYIDVGDLTFKGDGTIFGEARGYDNSVKIASISYQLNF